MRQEEEGVRQLISAQALPEQAATEAMAMSSFKRGNAKKSPHGVQNKHISSFHPVCFFTSFFQEKATF
jgi:hypothetical protein